MHSKYRDPLHVLLEYIAEVSALHVMFHFVTVNSTADAEGSSLRYGRRS
jgi:hypothetical protein